MSEPHTAGTNLAAGPDRRRWPRVEVLGHIHGIVVPMNLQVALHDASFGGFAIDSPISFPVDGTHQFRFFLPDGPPVVLNARVAHCRPLPTTDGRNAYRVGLEFAHLHAERDRQSVDRLIAQITRVIEALAAIH